jgi:hypothetical protein
MNVYCNYAITRDDITGRYVARPCNEDDQLELVSFQQSRITRAIDQIGEALGHFKGQSVKPSDLDILPIAGWIRSWLRSDANHVDIDHAFASGNL